MIWISGMYLQFEKNPFLLRFLQQIASKKSLVGVFFFYFLDLWFESQYHSKLKRGTPGSSKILLEVSIDLEILYPCREYSLLWRRQTKFLVFSENKTFKSKSKISHIVGQGTKTNSFPHKTQKSSYFTHFIFSTTRCSVKPSF